MARKGIRSGTEVRYFRYPMDDPRHYGLSRGNLRPRGKRTIISFRKSRRSPSRFRR